MPNTQISFSAKFTKLFLTTLRCIIICINVYKIKNDWTSNITWNMLLQTKLHQSVRFVPIT